MKKIIYMVVLGMTLAACSCGGGQKQTETKVIKDTIEPETGVTALRDMHVESSVKVKGEKYVYKYDFVHNEDMPIVRNPQGDDYYDNEVKLVIRHRGNVVIERTFTKNDFKALVPDEFMQTSALIGFTYNFTKGPDTDAMYFIATVGDPDETADMMFPIQMRITASGDITMEKATNLDTEPINPMTVDPRADGGV